MQRYSPEQADRSFEKYPAFFFPALSALPEASGEERIKLLRRIAVSVGDEETLRRIVGIDPEEFVDFYPDMKRPELSTDDTISSFIDRFSSEKAARTPQIDEIVPVAPAVDYAAQLAAGDPDEMPAPEPGDDPTASAIDAFLAAVPPKVPAANRAPKPRPVAPEPSETTPRADNAPLTESLAKAKVKNGNYHKALEIITELNLNNPKKSIYFADQMRFLKKLIANQERAKATKA